MAGQILNVPAITPVTKQKTVTLPKKAKGKAKKSRRK